MNKIGSLLRVLMVEDSRHDAELMADALRTDGYSVQWTRVESEIDFSAALRSAFDVILCDHGLPDFNPLRALNILRARALDVPLIIVSGAIGEDNAVQAIRLGAEDYLLKDRLTRLGAAVSAAVDRARLRAEMHRTSGELRQTRERLHDFLDNSPAVIFMKDREGRYLQVNKEFQRLIGLDAGAIIGKRDAEIFRPNDAAHYVEHDAQVLNAGKPIRFEETTETADGPRLSLVVKFPLLDDAGAVYGIGGIATDITERKRLEERYRATFEHASVGICHIAHDGYFKAANPKFCELLGYGAGELLRMRVRDILHPDEHADLRNLRRELLTHSGLQGVTKQRRLLTRRGAAVWVETSLSAVQIPREPAYFVAVVNDISERRMAEERFRATFEQVAVGIAHTSLDRRYLLVNDKLCELVGYTRDELLQMRTTDVVHPDDQLWLGRQSAIVEGTVQTFADEVRYIRKDRQVIWVSRTVSAVRDASGAPLYFLRVIVDVTARKRAEQRAALFQATTLAISESQNLHTALQVVLQKICESTGWPHGQAWLPSADEGTLQFGVAWNDGSSQLQPYEEKQERVDAMDVPTGPAGSVYRSHRPLRIPDIKGAATFKRREAALASGFNAWVGIPVVADDVVVALLEFFMPKAGDDDDEQMALVSLVAAQLGMLFQHKVAQDRIAFLANFDALTSLPNRVLVQDRLEQALTHALRHNRPLALCILDLDRFGVVNDTLGHTIGDKLVKCVAERLASAVRAGDTVGRVGGDEFALILPDLTEPADAALVAQKVLASLSLPFDIDGRELYIGASLGIALWPTDGANVETLFQGADAALYGAKVAGRNTYRFYTTEMNAQALERLELEQRLRGATGRNEFALHYQPKVDIATGQIVGVEGLLRWTPPNAEPISPGRFIPVLEESGLIIEVGDWVLRAACSQVRTWLDSNVQAVPVAINVSVRQLDRADFTEVIERTLREFGLDGRWLELEVTESAVMARPEETIARLAALRKLGVRVSMDDFGTGYSSLAYLSRMPVDTVKIDRSFIDELATNPDDASITQAIINMAHNLSLNVIAEGVETESQLSFLAAHDCNQMQGYYFSRPLAPPEVTELIRTGSRLTRPAGSTENGERALLLVDDDKNVLAALQRLLRRDRYELHAAASAKEAFEILANHKVGVILSDQRMPEMTGVAFLQRVKELYPAPVRMILSGYTDIDSVTDAINQGAVYRFLTKPWDDHLLRAHISEAFRSFSRGLESEREQQRMSLQMKELLAENCALRERLNAPTGTTNTGPLDSPAGHEASA